MPTGKVSSPAATLRARLHDLQARLAARERELSDALESAAHIQRSLIPRSFPAFSNLHYAWQFIPCKKVGGDLFNIAALDEQTIMTYLLDVSGHGIASAMVSVAVHQSLSPSTGRLVKRLMGHRPFYRITSPREVMATLDDEYPFERFEEFFSLTYLLINPHTGLVRYGNAGHPPPLLLRCNGEVARLDAGGPLIGLGHRADEEEGEVQLQEGDRLFLYTDGMTEQMNSQGEVYGESRLVAALYGQAGQPLDRACAATLADLRNHAAEVQPQDDVTLLGIEFTSKELAGLAT